ncbi:hypothetical protein ACIBG8_42740 [Nonomuraea sp. NPDC050556]|uniref:hypothetical protein n=1 Tax=Nonomuraea sp. NPDC050556 TaxID=3364369 RepID=UPI0037A5CEB1
MSNFADGSATVGIQTEAVHGDVHVYQLPPSPTPQERFELGVRHLHGGMPGKAREYIVQAVTDGYVTSRSCFYLILALLSGRTLQQVSNADLCALRSVQGKIKDTARDEWTEAIRMINRLFTSIQTKTVDSDVIEKELKSLGSLQQDEVLRDLEMFLSGTVQDALWTRTFDLAREERHHRRSNRVWRFFQPKPMEARVRRPRMVATTTGDWLRSIATSILALAAVGFVSVIAWRHSWLSAAIALLALAAGSYVCARNGVEWRFRTDRRRAKDQEFMDVRQSPASSGQRGGFVNKIDRQFTDYFNRYVPRNTDRAEWVARTAGIRKALRDEVVDLYRESRIDAKRVAWLTRYLVSDVKARWQAGTLREYQETFRVSGTTKAAFAAGLAVLTIGATMLVSGGFQSESLRVVAATVIALPSGWLAVRSWLRIALENKRYAAEYAESERLLADRQAALERWRKKLADKPDDQEMARWLDCDRKALMEEAMHHYKLVAHDVIAHAFIEAPAATYKRARVKTGPWRYSRYTLLIFLLTADGVRQMTVDLDFEEATFHNRARINYRYDAVAAVQVSEADSGERVFELTLVNGHPIKVEVTGRWSEPVEPGEDMRTVSQVTLDAAGLGNTLHILEGVAAEGKKWINHERQREAKRLADLTSAAHQVFL